MNAVIERLLAALPSAKPQGDGWEAKCPAHEDERASLSIGIGDDGRALVKCHAGCTAADIVRALGLTLADLFPAKPQRFQPADITYDYHNETGQLLFQVVRSRGKQFWQRRPNGNGGWVNDIKGVRRVLYRLPEIKGHQAVLIAEGEKDVNTLRAQGFTATTNPCGAGHWRDEYATLLKQAGCTRVAILPDNDPAGDMHARAVARSCHAAGLFVKVVRLADLPRKGDISDYLRTHTRDDLRAAIKVAPPFNPQQSVTTPVAVELTSLSQLLSEPDEQHAYCIRDRVPSGAVTLLAAPPKAGKSTLARAMAFAVATGAPCLGWSTQRGPCWYLALEEKRSEVRKAFKRLGANGSEPIHVLIAQAPNDLLAQLHELARTEKPSLIIVDTLQRLIKAKDLNDYALVTTAFEPLLALARDSGAALLLLHHASAHATREGLDAVLGSTALSASVDNVLVLKRSADGRRALSSVQRIGPDLEPVVLALNSTTGVLSIAGREADIAADEIATAILDALGAQPDLTETDIRRQVDYRLKDQWRALRVLLKDGRVTRTGQGKRGNPYRYSRVDSCSHENDAGNKKREQEKVIDPKAVKFDFSFLAPDPIKTNGNQKPSTEITPASSLPTSTDPEEPELAEHPPGIEGDDDVYRY